MTDIDLNRKQEDLELFCYIVQTSKDNPGLHLTTSQVEFISNCAGLLLDSEKQLSEAQSVYLEKIAEQCLAYTKTKSQLLGNLKP